MSDFASRLRGLRLKYYWNQSQLAKRAGVSTSLISSYEKSERFPSVDTVSYTHLDVYKRQEINLPILRQCIGF